MKPSPAKKPINLKTGKKLYEEEEKQVGDILIINFKSKEIIIGYINIQYLPKYRRGEKPQSSSPNCRLETLPPRTVINKQTF